MSATRVLIDGAARAAQLVPLLFVPVLALGPSSASAQMPRLPTVTVTAPQPVALDVVTENSPLTLAASHMDVRIVGGAARVRTTLTWRNDGALPVLATWQVPATMQAALLEELASEGCGDFEPQEGTHPVAQGKPQATEAEVQALLEQIEAGERPAPRRGDVMLEPGAEASVVVERELPLLVRGDRHRLVLPLVTQRHGIFTPQFSAEVTIDAARPIVDLGSATHAAEVSGVGDTQAALVIPNGRVHEGQFLAVEFMLGDQAAPAPAPLAALTGWGGEFRARR